MGTTLWSALADAYPNFKRDEWTLVKTEGTTSTLSNVHEPDISVYVLELSNGVFYVALSE